MDNKEEKTRAEELSDQVEEAVASVGGRARLAEKFGSAVVKLSKPAEYEGRTMEEIRLEFIGLTGLDMEIIDYQIGVMGLRGMLPAYSRKYQRMLAARAADLPEEFFLRLPLADYNAVVGAAQNFLMVTG